MPPAYIGGSERLSAEAFVRRARLSWPDTPGEHTVFAADVRAGRAAHLARTSGIARAVFSRDFAEGGSPVTICLHPASATPPQFRTVWQRIVREATGPAAWMLRWMLRQSTAAHRAALCREDYLECLTSPSADIRLLGPMFVTEQYQLESRVPVTASETVRRMVQRARDWLGASSPVAAWALPETPTETPHDVPQDARSNQTRAGRGRR